jgi:hypothetical protein
MAGADAGSLSGRTKREVKAAWGLAVFWNLVSSPLIVVAPRQIEEKPLVALAGLFPLVGLWLVVHAVRVSARWRRFGEATFALQRPASPGGVLAGHVRWPNARSFPDGSIATVALRCLRRTIDRDKDVDERILWQEEVDVPLDPSTAGLPVSIPIPSDAEATTAAEGGAGIHWVLTVDASLPGVNAHERFEVPVDRVGTEGPFAPASRPPSRSGNVAIDEGDLARAGIDVRAVDGRTVFRFAPARNPSFALGLTAFLAIWTGALTLQRVLGVPWVFIAMTAAVEILLVVVAVDLWLGVTVVAVGDGRIDRTYRVLGIPSRRTWNVPDVKAIDIAITSQTSGPTGTPYYDVRATLTSGRHVTLGPRVRQKRQAEWLASRIQELAGLRRPHHR